MCLCKNHQHLSYGPRDVRLQVSSFHFLKQISEHLKCSITHIKQASFQVPLQTQIFFPEFVSKYVSAKRHFKVTACLELEGRGLRPPRQSSAPISQSRGFVCGGCKTFLTLLQKMNPGTIRQTSTQKLKHMLFSCVYWAKCTVRTEFGK